MQIVRTIGWVLLLFSLLAFSFFNWKPVEVQIWSNLVLETKLPALVVVSFLPRPGPDVAGPSRQQMACDAPDQCARNRDQPSGDASSRACRGCGPRQRRGCNARTAQPRPSPRTGQSGRTRAFETRMTNPIYLALDVPHLRDGLDLAKKVKGHVGGIKLGLEFFCAHGAHGVHMIGQLGLPIFLDLKLYDIPNTVAGAMQAIHVLEPSIVTVHASGGRAMMEDAKGRGQRKHQGSRRHHAHQHGRPGPDAHRYRRQRA